MAINRRLGVDDAMDTVQLALQFKSKSNGIIVGVDLSGDPRVSSASEILTKYQCACRLMYTRPLFTHHTYLMQD